MAEIDNINYQLHEIVGEKMGIPVVEDFSNTQDYLCCIAAGMIQFVCIRTGRESYRSLTADHICIHPGSAMFKQDPVYIVAGEIVRTSRIYAMSVSPLTKPMLDQINPQLYEQLNACKRAKIERSDEVRFDSYRNFQQNKKAKDFKKDNKKTTPIPETDEAFYFGGEVFATNKIKGKKTAILPLDQLLQAVNNERDEGKIKACQNLKGKVILKDKGLLLEGEKLSLILPLAKELNLIPISEKQWNRKLNANINDPFGKEQIINSLEIILRVAMAKQKNKEYGFIALYNDGKGTYWFKISRGFSTALAESHSSLEILIEEQVDFSNDERRKINDALYLVNKFYQ